MTWEHLKAFVWLRWRLSVNQWRKGGALNAALMIILVILCVITAIPLFVGCFALGVYLIPRAAPIHLLYVWDGLVGAMLLFWSIGLLVELQRSESLALSKFLHLPVTPTGAFLINYLGSLLRLSLLFFGPVMFGWAFALVYAKGLALWPAVPLLVAFLLMITALTYQFQGWLAALMSDPRRRRTVIVVATATFILIFQLPNLLNFLAPWQSQAKRNFAQTQEMGQEIAKLGQAVARRELTPAEFTRRSQQIQEQYKLARQRAEQEAWQHWGQVVRLTNLVVPFGWLPLGVMLAAEGSALLAMLPLAGMTLIGTASLWRAYRTTVGQYQGRSTRRKSRTAAAVSAPARSRQPSRSVLEAHLPGVSEPVSAVALAALRSLLRAPEAKMMLLTPLITGVVFGSAIWRGRHGIPVSLRPYVGLGAMVFVLLGMLQLAGNQFGFDRDGFRVYVLSSARRRDILMGKNLGLAPLALGIAAVQLLALQAICPLRLDHFLAMLPLYLTMFLLFCLFANLLSTLAPIYIAAGSLKPANPKLTTGLLQFVMFLFLFPLTQAPAFVPLGVESALGLLGWTRLPIGLALALLELAVVALFYRLVLEWEGELFQTREQRILEAVTKGGP